MVVGLSCVDGTLFGAALKGNKRQPNNSQGPILKQPQMGRQGTNHFNLPCPFSREKVDGAGSHK